LVIGEFDGSQSWRVEMTRASDLEDRLVRFGASICRCTNRLPRSKIGIHIESQLLRSATSPAANYAEAQAGESHRDFAHKLKLCLKELRETLVWLKLIQELHLLRDDSLPKALKEADELVALFVASVRTAEQRELPALTNHHSPTTNHL
jgi:four helix bundle protein